MSFFLYLYCAIFSEHHSCLADGVSNDGYLLSNDIPFVLVMELNVEESFCEGGKHFVGEELLPRRGVDDVSERKGREKSQNESC